MNYTDFFSGVGVTLIVLACIWLIRIVAADPVPEIPEKPKRKRGAPSGPRKPRISAGMGAGMTPPESAASTTA